MIFDPDTCLTCLDSWAHFGVSGALYVFLSIPPGAYRRPWWHRAILVLALGLGYEIWQGLTATGQGTGFGFGAKDFAFDVAGVSFAAWWTK